MSLSDSFFAQSPERALESRRSKTGAELDERAARLFERIAYQGDTVRTDWYSFNGRLALATAALDLLAIGLGFAVAVLIAGGLRGIFGIEGVPAWPFLQQRGHELLLLSGLAIGIFAFGGLYRRNSWELDEIKRVVAGVALLAMIDATLQYTLRDHNSRLWFFAAYPTIALFVISFRMAFRALPAVQGAITSHVILLGSGVSPDLLVFELRESRATPVRLLSSLPLSEMERQDLQKLDESLDRITASSGVPAHRMQIVLAPAAEELEEAQELLELLNALHRPYSIILPFRGLARNGLRLQNVIGADMVMAEMRPSGTPRLVRAGKSLFDLLSAGLFVLVLSPVLLTLCMLLLIEGGPVLFRQTRVGRNGRRFRCFKFRTMHPDAEERLNELLASDPVARAEWSHYQKLRNDPRITPVGRFLRKTSLDELPQLFNVLLGDMSLVGPRPIVAPEVAGYPHDRAYFFSPDFAYYVRCTPGLTGLWQVSGRSETRHEERVRLDRWYARNQSIWLDLMILLKTVRVVLFGTGA